MQDLVKKIEYHVRPIVENLSLSLWGIDVQKGAKILVRIYLEDDGLAGIDECAKVSRLVGLVLDVEEFFVNPWILEVSTPGLDRMFFSLEQMEKYVDEDLQVSLLGSVDSEVNASRRKLMGTLIKVNTKEQSFDIHSLDDDRNYTVEWDNVKKAKIVPKIKMPEKPMKKKEKNN